MPIASVYCSPYLPKPASLDVSTFAGNSPVAPYSQRLQARNIFRDLIDTPADVEISEAEAHVHFHRRTLLPIIIASKLLDAPVKVPWWHNHTLRMSA